jgi:hypothetical protein
MRILYSPADSVKISLGLKRSLLLAAIAGSLMALAFGLPRLLQRSSAHGIDSAGPKQQGCCSNVPAMLRRMVGTYYTTEGNFKSTLILNNKGPNQIAVTPILHSQNGQTFTAPIVAVGGESSQEVDLNALASIAGPQFRSGSFEFTYNGRMLEMGGGLRIVDSRKSLIFDEQLLEPGMKFSSAQLKAVYAVPFDSAKVSVIVTNTTAQPVAVEGQATFAGANGRHPVRGVLRPYEMSVVDLPPGLVRNASAGAVSIDHNGPKGALLAMIHVLESDRGYSESVNFADPAQGKTTEWHGAGLRLGSVGNDALKPVIAVRNIGSIATTVTASVPYSKQNGDTGRISLPQFSLAPGERKLFDASNPQLRQRDFATAGLEIKYTGTPGSLIASTTSVSQSGNHVFTLPLKDPQGGMSSTGGYPWFINGSSSTVVFIKNASEKEQTFRLDLIYEQGLWGSNLRKLAPHETYAIDIRKIRDAQVKGSRDGTLPFDVKKGHVYWTIFGSTEKALIGRAQTVDLTGGIASTYECQTCACPPGYYGSLVEPITHDHHEPGGTRNYRAMQQDLNCYGSPGSWFLVTTPITWSTDNSNIATVNSVGTVTAQNQQGGTTVSATWTAYNGQWNPNSEYCDQFQTSAGGWGYFQTDPPIPHHVRVVSDIGGFPPACLFTGVYVRQVTVQVVNQYNRNVTSGSVQEGFTNLTTNTCGNGAPNPTSCGVLDVFRRFTDTMTVSGNVCGSGISQGSGCGYTLTSTWRICGTQSMNIWTYNGETRSNIVRVNGTTQISSGTELFP